jgi:hypothetical protein
LVSSERIVNRDWGHYDFHHVVFQPAGRSAEALQAGHDWVTYEFYRPWRIARRLWRHARRPDGLATLRHVAAVNLAYYGRVLSWGIRGWDPGRMRNAMLPAAFSDRALKAPGLCLGPSGSAYDPHSAGQLST